MWLYPAPLIIAGLGWLVIYFYSDVNAPDLHPVELSLAWVAAGAISFFIWAKREKTWPFGPLPVDKNEVDEEISVHEVNA